MARYGMIIDLRRCIGCHACTVACKAEQNVPNNIFWSTVVEKEIGIYPKVTRLFLPILCNHCRNPWCVDVCPTGATYSRSDGIVMMDYSKCIGCRACAEACPYRARTFVRDPRTLYDDGKTVFNKPVPKVIEKGVSSKCNFCFHRVDEGRVPACVEVCPTECRIFGDLEDPRGKAFECLHSSRAFQLLPEKGTDPSVYYLR
jgi:molybdopterin-containing oxidoreductase family iron-sulfur binding subunit